MHHICKLGDLLNVDKSKKPTHFMNKLLATSLYSSIGLLRFSFKSLFDGLLESINSNCLISETQLHRIRYRLSISTSSNSCHTVWTHYPRWYESVISLLDSTAHALKTIKKRLNSKTNRIIKADLPCHGVSQGEGSCHDSCGVQRFCVAFN